MVIARDDLRRRSILLDQHLRGFPSDGSYKLIDPAGLRAEPTCDLGTIVRCNPDFGDEVWARTEQLASRTGTDTTAIWEWVTIHRVVSGVYACSIGFQSFGDLLLAEADRLTA
ncbi:hypothetical protein ACIQI8_17645 [Streptomyces sp. NPDC092369]|uniref:hypothetical protein n=1 Tax=Streptomyces sp. NPDC092369 TaxID=3366015 RepID=UPI003826E916